MICPVLTDVLVLSQSFPVLLDRSGLSHCFSALFDNARAAMRLVKVASELLIGLRGLLVSLKISGPAFCFDLINPGFETSACSNGILYILRRSLSLLANVI